MWCATIFRFRKAILAFAIVSTIGLAVYASGAVENLAEEGFFSENSESYKILKESGKKFVAPLADYTAILEHDVWNVTSPEFLAAFEDFKAAILRLPLHSIASPAYPHEFVASEDSKKMYVTFRKENGAPAVTAADLHNAMFGVPLTATFGGWLLEVKEVKELIMVDLAYAELATLPVIIFFLILAFQGLVAFLPSLLIAFICTVWSLVAIRLTNMATPMSGFTFNVITTMGMGLAVDYSLFVILRFREERLKFPKHDIRFVMERVMVTSGRTVFFSAVTVAISLTGTFFFHAYYIYSMGFAMILVVFFAAAASLTVLPAILFIFDSKVFVWPLSDIFDKIFRRNNRKKTREIPTIIKAIEFTSDTPKHPLSDVNRGWWYRTTILSMRFAIPLCTVIIAGLIALLYVFFSKVKWGCFSPVTLPSTSPTRYVYETLQNEFPMFGRSQLSVFIQTDTSRGVWREKFLRDLDEFATNIENFDSVLSVSCLVRISQNKTIDQYVTEYESYRTQPDLSSNLRDPFYLTNMDDITFVNLALSKEEHSKASVKVLEYTRKLLKKSFLDSDGNSYLIKTGVTGMIALSHDQQQDVLEQAPKCFAVTIIAVYILLLVMTGSVILPLKAIFVGILSISASLGVVVLVFQEGIGSDVLHFTSPGFTDGLQLIFIAFLAFGMSMDYELFIIGRIQEYYERAPNTRIAVACGMQGSARSVTMAAIVLAVVTGAFISTRTGTLKLIGLGVALSVIVDVTIVRAFLVPGMMEIMGNLNWWSPAWLKRWIVLVNLKEKLVEEPAPEQRPPIEIEVMRCDETPFWM